MNVSSPVCRTCLGIISEEKKGYNIDEENGLVKNVRNIREMIQFCVPEINIFISVSPSICEPCLSILINCYNFKIRCMRVENAIQSYVFANSVMDGSCIDLTNIVKQQIGEALRRKDWSQSQIRDYIQEVDICLKPILNKSQKLASQNMRQTLHQNNIQLPRDIAVFPVPKNVNRCTQLKESSDSSQSNIVDLTDNSSHASKRTHSMILSSLNFISTGGREEAVLNTSADQRSISTTVGGPKEDQQKEAVSNSESQIIEDDDDEVLIMNFDEGVENSVRTQAPLEVPSLDTSESTAKHPQNYKVINPAALYSKKPIVSLSQFDKTPLKRKLIADKTIEEILAKRRKIVSKTDSDSPGLCETKRLTIRMKNDRFFKCMFCTFATLRPKELRGHYSEWHKICKLCGFKSDKKPLLDQHIASIHQKRLDEFINCTKTEKNEYGCSLCHFKANCFPDIQYHNFVAHLNIDHTGVYKCPHPDCNTIYDDFVNMSQHIETKHGFYKSIDCPLCNHVCATVYNLRSHLLSHKSKKNIFCLLCKFRCKTTFALERHLSKKHRELDDNQPGVVYETSSGSMGDLVTDHEGRITLNLPKVTTNITKESTKIKKQTLQDEVHDFSLLSLSEMICDQAYQEAKWEGHSGTGIKKSARSKKKRVILNQHNKKSHQQATTSKDEAVVMTVDSSDEEGIHELSKEASSRDVIEIDDDVDDTYSNSRTDNGSSNKHDIRSIDADNLELNAPCGIIPDPDHVETLESLLDEHINDTNKKTTTTVPASVVSSDDERNIEQTKDRTKTANSDENREKADIKDKSNHVHGSGDKDKLHSLKEKNTLTFTVDKDKSNPSKEATAVVGTSQIPDKGQLHNIDANHLDDGVDSDNIILSDSELELSETAENNLLNLDSESDLEVTTNRQKYNNPAMELTKGAEAVDEIREDSGGTTSKPQEIFGTDSCIASKTSDL